MAQSQNGNVATMMRSGQIAPERAAANKVLISLRIVAWLFPCRKKLSSNWLRFSILGQHGARICSVPSFRYLPGQREQYNPPACLNQESVGMKHDADDAGLARFPVFGVKLRGKPQRRLRAASMAEGYS
jgi:hypothetical protein